MLKMIDRALALIGLRRIKPARQVAVRLVANPEARRAIAQAVNRAVRATRNRY